MKYIFFIIICSWAMTAASGIVINSDSSTRAIVTNTAIKRAGDRISGTFDAAGQTVFVSDVRLPDTNDITYTALDESNDGAGATYMSLPWSYISFTNSYMLYGGEYVYAAEGFMYLFYDTNLLTYAIYNTHPTNAAGAWFFTNTLGGTSVLGDYSTNAAQSDVAGALNLYSRSAVTNAVTLSQSNGTFLINGLPVAGPGGTNVLMEYTTAVSNQLESKISAEITARIAATSALHSAAHTGNAAWSQSAAVSTSAVSATSARESGTRAWSTTNGVLVVGSGVDPVHGSTYTVTGLFTSVAAYNGYPSWSRTISGPTFYISYISGFYYIQYPSDRGNPGAGWRLSGTSPVGTYESLGGSYSTGSAVPAAAYDTTAHEYGHTNVLEGSEQGWEITYSGSHNTGDNCIATIGKTTEIVQDNLYQVTISANTYTPEPGGGCTITITVKDLNGDAVASNFAFPVWVSASAGGAPMNHLQVSISGVSDATILNGAVETTAWIWIATGTDGDATVTLDAGDEWTNYVNVLIGDKIYSSSLIEWMML